MRKIENEMLTAVLARRPWQAGNTAVTFTKEPDPEHQFGVNECVTVYLHGNRIAYQNPYDLNLLHIDHGTLKKYPTRTTLSRLRALGFTVNISKGTVLVSKGIIGI